MNVATTSANCAKQTAIKHQLPLSTSQRHPHTALCDMEPRPAASASPQDGGYTSVHSSIQGPHTPVRFWRTPPRGGTSLTVGGGDIRTCRKNFTAAPQYNRGNIKFLSIPHVQGTTHNLARGWPLASWLLLRCGARVYF